VGKALNKTPQKPASMAKPAKPKKNRHKVTSERSKANWSTTAARSGTRRTGLMDFAWRNYA